MESEKKIAARDKVIERAGAWLGRRNTKAGLTGEAKNQANTKLRESERDLADAVEKFEKEN